MNLELALAPTVRKYWTEFLPEKVKELEKERALQASIVAKAREIADRIRLLVAEGGYQEHEAQESALAELLYAEKPEANAGVPKEQVDEIAEMEREYQAHPAPVLTEEDADKDLR